MKYAVKKQGKYFMYIYIQMVNNWNVSNI